MTDPRYDLARLLNSSSIAQKISIHRGHLVEGHVCFARVVDGDFCNWHVYNSRFEGCTFIRCQWKNVDFRNVVFDRCVLIDCHFQGSVDANFIESVREFSRDLSKEIIVSTPKPPQQPVIEPIAPPPQSPPSRFLHLD